MADSSPAECRMRKVPSTIQKRTESVQLHDQTSSNKPSASTDTRSKRKAKAWFDFIWRMEWGIGVQKQIKAIRILLIVVGVLYSAFFLYFVGHEIVHMSFYAPPKLVAELKRWRPGFFDIHHLKAGLTETSFIILPDGTTILVDAGDLDINRHAQH